MHRFVSCAARTAVAVALLSAVTGRADAGGLYWSDRGVRPMGRAGAFVAGADDLGAVWYNNAGISSAGASFLFDATMMLYGADFTRRTQRREQRQRRQNLKQPQRHSPFPAEEPAE